MLFSLIPHINIKTIKSSEWKIYFATLILLYGRFMWQNFIFQLPGLVPDTIKRGF